MPWMKEYRNDLSGLKAIVASNVRIVDGYRNSNWKDNKSIRLLIRALGHNVLYEFVCNGINGENN